MIRVLFLSTLIFIWVSIEPSSYDLLRFLHLTSKVTSIKYSFSARLLPFLNSAITCSLLFQLRLQFTSNYQLKSRVSETENSVSQF